MMPYERHLLLLQRLNHKGPNLDFDIHTNAVILVAQSHDNRFVLIRRGIEDIDIFIMNILGLWF